MAHEVIWTKEIYEEFINKSLLTDEELDVIRTRVILKWSIQRQALELGMSVSKVNAITKRLKQKYDEVQPFSDILKPRKIKKKI